MGAPKGFRVVSEGKAKLLYPENGQVFYNPIQQFNRDLSVLALRAWTEVFLRSNKRRRDSETNKIPFLTVVEALAASGIRSCRYAKEVPRLSKVIVNDISMEAVKLIRHNAEFNDISKILDIRHDDANSLLYSLRRSPVHAVDLDPYGSAAPYLDAAVQSVISGGIIMVTCTDMAVLAGNGYPEKCYSQYGGTTVRNDAAHESALRLLLHSIATTAARYGRSIRPLLSLSIDYYIRCFVRICHSPKQVKLNLGKSMIIYNCTGCRTSYFQPLGKTLPLSDGNYKFGWAQGPPIGSQCANCHSVLHVSGPMWSGSLHCNEFLDEMICQLNHAEAADFATTPRIEGMLHLARQELDTPFYISPASMASCVRCPVPPLQTFVSALFNGGYDVSLTHAKAGCVKTTAPHEFIWDIWRAWALKQGKGKLKERTPGFFILEQPQVSSISFEKNVKADSIERLRKNDKVLFQPNPRPSWGPMSKPKQSSAT